MKKWEFLSEVSDKIIEENDKIYKGLVPWALLNSKEKKTIYVSTSNRNIENYFYTLDEYKEQSTAKVKKEIVMFENISQKKEDLLGINIELLHTLKTKSDFVLFLNLQIALDVFFEKVKHIDFEIGKEYKMREILEFLNENNYTSEYIIEEKGQFSKRGDIIDIYPANEQSPIRLEFFDDELEGIRIFDLDTQKSIEKIEKIRIHGNILTGKNYELTELLQELKDEEIEIIIENEELLNYKLEEYILLERDKEEVYRKRYNNFKKRSKMIETVNFTDEQLETFKNIDKVKKLSVNKNIEIYTNNIKKMTLDYEGSSVNVNDQNLFEGFIINNTFILTDREIEGFIHEKKRKANQGIKYKKTNQIIENDYVIHTQYGVGLYKGIETINERDYLKIKYADEDLLYIPVEGLDRLEKYISYGEEPKLYKLGTRGFKKRKEKLLEEIEIFAKELIKIQAQRQSIEGYTYNKDTIWQEEFEEQFPFDETDDQKKAINDVKADMESHRIMDRIVCGDVGYGKTEVAMRAAFKAIENSKQVALIAPTTILAEQHFKRFKQRFQNYPITIENLSRLTEGKTSDILKKLEKGTIDLVIGTHRLLSNDVNFNNLGMLIIDEEQKFGVKAKENLKAKKEKVDVLTLTATPIPRTLNLALLGIRDISIIDTPPTNRLPIITKVIDYEKEEIKTAILKELSRDGQIFYIYNEVINMEAKKKELKEMLPDFVKIEYVHGKLVPKEIKDKIKRFEAGEFDILLASTIIENGIDISNVNTMIIENFDKLGLSQVYQLRGRVGRSNRQGYCYLLKNTRSTKKGKQKQESIDKIEGIKSGGFQISMEDLKIRGAGEILGDRQHGTIETFGYDLYIKMLNEEIQKQKGIYKERIENVQIIINNRGSIPETYISGEERLSIYKRFAMLETFDELRELIKEVQDRFGKIIGEVEKFVKYIELKIIAKDNGISLIKEDKKEYELIFEKTISQEFSNMVSLEENESIDEETGEVVYIQKITIEKSKLNEYIETLKVDY